MEKIANTATNRRNRYAFVAHWVETWNFWLLISNDLQQHPEHAWRWAFLWPVAFVISIILMVGKKTHDVVDRFLFGDNLAGEIVVVRFFAYQFMVKQLNLRNRIRKKILQTVLDVQDRVDVVGLGALCKDESLVQGGEWIVKKLGGQLRVPIVHGDTLTAAAVIQRARQLMKLFHLEGKPIVLTGSTSKIGRAIALEFARRGVKVFMYTQSQERFKAIQNEAEENGRNLYFLNRLEHAAGVARLYITGKANKGADKQLMKVLPLNAVVLNFAVPDPLSSRLLRARPDIHHFDGGLMGFDPKSTTLEFNMRLLNWLTYACHAGTAVHAAEGWTHNEVGQVQMDQLERVWNAAYRNGFYLPAFTSFLKPVEDGPTTWKIAW